MNAHRICLVVAVVISLQFVQTRASAQELSGSSLDHTPINVIFDTDMWSDIDDALALAMLHALEDRGEVNLLAVTIGTNDRWCASYTSLLNTFYGHSQVPIGIIRNGMDLEYFREKSSQFSWPVTRYTQQLSEQRNKDGTSTYPHRFGNGSAPPDAAKLLRKTLAAQPDRSVVMIQVGYSSNFARLLDSQADAISGLDGRQLIAKKVRLLTVMAGSFRDATYEGKTVTKSSPEFNVWADIPSAQKLFSSWPTPIVASGFEIGLNLLYPPESIKLDYNYVRNHPIAQSYLTYCEEKKGKLHITTCPHAHATFDLTAVLYAARPNRNYFSLSNSGRIIILDDGSSRFEEAPEGRDRYLILNDEQKARTLEAMVMLASQPPRGMAQR